jgi:hypothetical protein
MNDLQMTCPQIREGEGAITIIAHDFIGQRYEAEARKFKVSDPGPGIDDDGDDYARGVVISYVERGRRKWRRAYAVDDNWSFLLVEYKGRVIYDSRLDVPCDFEPRRREQEARRREREQSA